MSPPERDDTVSASLEPDDDCPPHSQQSGRFCPEYKAKVESVSPSEFDLCGVEVKTEPFGFECCQQEREQSPVALRYPLEGQKTLPSAESLEGGHPGIRRLLSWPSLSCRVQQQPGFHREVLQPYYSLQPVSNVVMGLVYGSSSYAQQCVSAGLATIIHTSSGCFVRPTVVGSLVASLVCPLQLRLLSVLSLFAGSFPCPRKSLNVTCFRSWFRPLAHWDIQ